MTIIKKSIAVSGYDHIYIEVETDHNGGDVELEQNGNTISMDFDEAKGLASALLKAVEFAEEVK